MKTTSGTLTSLGDLSASGLLNEQPIEALDKVADRYAIAIPRHVRTLLSRGNGNGALRRQFIPQRDELTNFPEQHADPIGDQSHSPVKGIVHRYHDRVLFKIINVCPVYCRFCFRREMLGSGDEAVLNTRDTSAAVAYIASQPDISEVIFTGGDPLVLSPRRIASLNAQLSDIPHVSRIRWHSRVPVVAPERMTQHLITSLTTTNKKVRIAVHTNHASELTNEARRACKDLHSAGIELLSQSVLLRGVNDTPTALSELIAACRRSELRPYYLHQLDQARGTQHFRVPIVRGRALMAELERTHTRCTRPRYMLDIPGGFGKVEIRDQSVRYSGPHPDGALYRLRDPQGRVHIYLDRR